MSGQATRIAVAAGMGLCATWMAHAPDSAADAPSGAAAAGEPHPSAGRWASPPDEFAPPAASDWLLGFPDRILPRSIAPSAPRYSRGRAVDGKIAGRRLLFTFDDGPYPTTTPRLLDILAREEVPAVFFLVGNRLSDKPRFRANRLVARRIAAQGHVVGNHSYNHLSLPDLDERRRKEQIIKAHEAIREVVGYAPTLFRPPFGNYNVAMDHYLTYRGYTRVMWRYAGDEFRGRSARVIAHDLFRRIRERDRSRDDPGGVILLHDSHSTSVDAAEMLIRRIKAENCDLLGAGDEDIWRFVDFEPFFEPINGPDNPLEGPSPAGEEALRRARQWCREHEDELDHIRRIVDRASLTETE